MDGDRALLAELADLFKEQAPVTMKEIRRAVDGADYPALQRAAHTLRGSLMSFGARHAAEAALVLEGMGRDRTTVAAQEPIESLQREIVRLQQALQQLAVTGTT